jgi:O-antigen/teichoic acid export membrane protein
MTENLAKQAGTAVVWKAAQLAGIKGIFLARLLILARLLAPEDFGLLAIAMTAIGFLLKVTDIGMIPALVQRLDATARHYHSAWTVGVLRAANVTVITALAAPIIASLFGEPQAVHVIQVLALRPLLEATASIKVAELTRQMRFRSLACISVPAAIVETLVAIALARHLGVWALVIGVLTGSAASVLLSYIMAPYRPHLSFNWSAVRPLIQYGRWIFITGLLSLAGSSVLQVVISRRLGAAELGVYFLAGKLAFLPYEVVSEVMGSVAFPLYARLQAKVVQAGRAFQTIVTGMASLLLPTYTLLIVLAPSLVQNVLGPRWTGTVPVIQVLALVGIVGLSGDAIGPLLRGFGRPSLVAVLEVIQSSLLILLVWSLAGRYGLVGAALAWLLAIGVSQVFSVMFARQLLHRPFAGLGAPLLAIAAVSAVGAMLAVGINSTFAGVIGLVVAGLAAVAVTVSLLWVLDRRFHLGLAGQLHRAFPQVASLVGLSPAGG